MSLITPKEAFELKNLFRSGHKLTKDQNFELLKIKAAILPNSILPMYYCNGYSEPERKQLSEDYEGLFDLRKPAGGRTSIPLSPEAVRGKG